MTSSVDGLVSGLSTSDLISKLMQVESAPQTALKTKLANEQKTITAYQTVNVRMAAVQTAAEALTKDLTWQGAKATTSSDAVGVSATAGAATGEFTFDVTSVAKAQVSTAKLASSGALIGPGGLRIKVGSADEVAITVTTETPQGIADAINAKKLGVVASVVSTDSGSVLQLNASKTGTSAGFTVSGLTTAVTDLVPASDAKLTIGDPNAGGYRVSSSTNTFSNVLPGLTVSVIKPQAGVTVQVSADQGSVADRMQTLVDAANAALAEVSKQTAYDPSTKTGATLTGDFGVRQLASNLLSAVADGKPGFGSFQQLGVQLDKSGRLTFDRSKFLDAYQKDPAKVQAAVATKADPTAHPPVAGGLAGVLLSVATGATDPTKGSLTTAIQGGDTMVNNLTSQIAGWDVRLSTRQGALQRQFASLEVALGKLKDQSSWLAGQISSLPTSR